MKKPHNTINNKFITQMVTKLNDNYILLIRPYGNKKKISIVRVEDNMHFFFVKTITIAKDILPDTGYVLVSKGFNKVYVIGGVIGNEFVTSATIIHIAEVDGEFNILLEKIDTDFTIAMPSIISNEEGFILQGGFTSSAILSNSNFLLNHKNTDMLKCNITSSSITSTVMINNFSAYDNIIIPTNHTNNVISGRLLARDICMTSVITDDGIDISVTPVIWPTYVHVNKVTLNYKELMVMFCGNKSETPIDNGILSYDKDSDRVDYFKKLMYIGDRGQLEELPLDLQLTTIPALYDMIPIKNNILFVACDTLDGRNMSIQIKKIPLEYFN